eukprot:759236-Hanusia_phi.AAC.1
MGAAPSVHKSCSLTLRGAAGGGGGGESMAWMAEVERALEALDHLRGAEAVDCSDVLQRAKHVLQLNSSFSLRDIMAAGRSHNLSISYCTTTPQGGSEERSSAVHTLIDRAKALLEQSTRRGEVADAIGAELVSLVMPYQECLSMCDRSHHIEFSHLLSPAGPQPRP